MLATITAQFSIDGQPAWGRLEVNQDVEFVRSLDAVKPDPAWEFTDAAGHWHAFATEGKLPTLSWVKGESYWCEDCHEHHDGPGHHACRICGEEIKPSYLPDWEVINRGTPVYGMKTWSVELEVPDPDALTYQPGKEVLVRHDTEQATYFGVGLISNVNLVVGDDDSVATVEIAGHGPLGQRLTV